MIDYMQITIASHKTLVQIYGVTKEIRKYLLTSFGVTNNKCVLEPVIKACYVF